MNRNEIIQRTPEEYLQLPYTIVVHHDTSVDPPGWVARVVELPGCITQADTLEELGEMIEEAMLLWIETELEDGEQIPEPRSVDDYSGRFVVRMPGSIHRDVVHAAEREGVSLNAFMNSILAREVGRAGGLATEDNLLPSPDPRPAWNRLSPIAYRALVAAGVEAEAEEITEDLFSRWLGHHLNQVDASLRSGHIRDAENHLQKCQRALEICGQSSPIMAIFSQTTQILVEQVELVVNLQAGIVEQSVLNMRISGQIAKSTRQSTSRHSHIQEYESSVTDDLAAHILKESQTQRGEY